MQLGLHTGGIQISLSMPCACLATPCTKSHFPITLPITEGMISSRVVQPLVNSSTLQTKVAEHEAATAALLVLDQEQRQQ